MLLRLLTGPATVLATGGGELGFASVTNGQTTIFPINECLILHPDLIDLKGSLDLEQMTGLQALTLQIDSAGERMALLRMASTKACISCGRSMVRRVRLNSEPGSRDVTMRSPLPNTCTRRRPWMAESTPVQVTSRFPRDAGSCDAGRDAAGGGL